MCLTPIRRTHRYADLVRAKLAQIEAVKLRINGYESTRRGNALLNAQDHARAQAAFREALAYNPGLPDARLGLGCALLRAMIGSRPFVLSFCRDAPDETEAQECFRAVVGNSPLAHLMPPGKGGDGTLTSRAAPSARARSSRDARSWSGRRS